MRQITHCILLLSVLLITGCQAMKGIVHTSPVLALKTDTQLSPVQPIYFSVVDDNSNQREGNFADSLINSVCSAYPKSFRVTSPNSIPVQGQVSIKINVRKLGAFFNRTAASVLKSSGYTTSISGNTDGWQQVIAASSQINPVISGHVGGWRFAPGQFHGWAGVAYFDIEVHDHRRNQTNKFMISIAAERSTANTLGYLSAKMNAADAWDDVAPQLANFIDASAKKISNEGKSEQASSFTASSCMK